MLGAKWTERRRQQIIVAVAVLIIAVVVGVTVGLLNFIDRQLRQNSEQQVVTFTQQAATNVTDRMHVVQDAIGAFSVQSSDPAEVAPALEAFKERFGFSAVAFAGLDGVGVYADGSRFTTADLVPEETALSEGRASYSKTFVNGDGVRVRTAQRPLSIGGQEIGALYVQIPLSMVSMSGKLDMFDGRGYFLIVDAGTGEILVPPTDKTKTDIQVDTTLYDFLDDAAGVAPEITTDASELLLSLQESVGNGLGRVRGIIESGETGLVIGSVDGRASYVCVTPVDQGEWYVCNVIPVKNVRAEAWGVMTAFQVVFAIVLLCLATVAGLVFLSYRKRVRDKNVAMLSQLYKALSETLDMAVNLYSPTDRAVTPIVAKAADIVGGSMVDLLADEGLPGSLGMSPEGLLLFERIRAGRIEGIEQGEFFVTDSATGKKRWVSYAVNKLMFEDKRQILVVMRDATVEKELQLSMQDAMLAAEAANHAKSDFLSRMSHEIRTPMNVIIGMLQIAFNNVGDAQKTQENLKKIGTASSHLLGLINDVLDISKIESGRMALASEPFRLETLVERTEAVIRPQCEQKGQSFQVVLEQQDDVLMGDAVRLQQMLVNLLTNSVKYTPENGHVKLEVLAKDGTTAAYRCVTVVVEDDGIGMSDEFKERLFEPFRMEGRSNAQGTGLGMPIVKNIVTMMGGDIQVSSRLDCGTRFTVTFNLRIAFEPERRALEAMPDALHPEWTEGFFAPQHENSVDLPRAGRRADRDAPGVSDKGAEAGAEEGVEGLRVLLAEDNELNAEIASELLSEAGMVVDWAADGREACRMFEDAPVGTYDVVLMDVQMPGLNGYEATRCIRGLERPDAQVIPIIAMSANAFADDVNASLASGMDAHLSKPININLVLSTVAQHVVRARKGGV